jgi:transcriptional regulator with XRE-family HTH domain
VKNEETPHPEDFAQILQRLKDKHGVSDSEIARRTGLHVSTVNSWVHRKRVPRPDAIRDLAAAFPDFTEEELSAAAGRKMPGPLTPEREERILELIRGLTAEQQAFTEAQLRGLNEANRS